MDKNQLELWCAFPDDLDSVDAAKRCVAFLPEEERARATTFASEAHRREELTARCLVRAALGHADPSLSETLQFVTGPYGKPRIASDSTLRFSLSRSSQLVACLVSTDYEVGIDVEPLTRAPEIAEMASSVLSPREMEQYSSLTEAEKSDRALSLWVLKEAYTKARGEGLHLSMKKISFLFAEKRIQLAVEPELSDDVQRWQYCLLEHAGHRVAVVTEKNPGFQLRILEARPVIAKPTSFDVHVPDWNSGAA